MIAKLWAAAPLATLFHAVPVHFAARTDGTVPPTTVKVPVTNNSPVGRAFVSPVTMLFTPPPSGDHAEPFHFARKNAVCASRLREVAAGDQLGAVAGMTASVARCC